jgi:hypothetical protein
VRLLVVMLVVMFVVRMVMGTVFMVWNFLADGISFNDWDEADVDVG